MRTLTTVTAGCLLAGSLLAVPDTEAIRDLIDIVRDLAEGYRAKGAVVALGFNRKKAVPLATDSAQRICRDEMCRQLRVEVAMLRDQVCWEIGRPAVDRTSRLFDLVTQSLTSPDDRSWPGRVQDVKYRYNKATGYYDLHCIMVRAPAAITECFDEHRGLCPVSTRP